MYGQFYNQGYYPNNFNQMYQMQQYQNNQPQQMQTQQVQNQQTDERIWVQGEESAKAYLVAPNSFVRLWDSSEMRFYEKRADQTGKPYMEVYEYKLRGSNAPNLALTNVSNGIDYMKEINALKSRIEALEKGSEEDVK